MVENFHTNSSPLEAEKLTDALARAQGHSGSEASPVRVTAAELQGLQLHLDVW